MLRLVAALRVSARTVRNAAPLVCASWNWPGTFPSVVTPAASIAAMGPGKLSVVTRLVPTGTVTTARSSSRAVWTGWPSARSKGDATISKTRKLLGDLIFEVAHSGGITSVQGHVGVANQAEPKRERKRLGERLFLEDA